MGFFWDFSAPSWWGQTATRACQVPGIYAYLELEVENGIGVGIVYIRNVVLVENGFLTRGNGIGVG